MSCFPAIHQVLQESSQRDSNRFCHHGSLPVIRNFIALPRQMGIRRLLPATENLQLMRPGALAGTTMGKSQCLHPEY